MTASGVRGLEDQALQLARGMPFEMTWAGDGRMQGRALRAYDSPPQRHTPLTSRPVAMSEADPMPDDGQRKVLTIHGERGWSKEDWEYAEGSIVRGYAGLNDAVGYLMRSNPDLVVHSVSDSSVMLPDGNIVMSATVLYSGSIIEDDWLELKGSNGYETVARVPL